MNAILRILALLFGIKTEPKKPVPVPVPPEPEEDFTTPVSRVPVPADSTPVSFEAAKSKVHNRGNPPQSFLIELLEWARLAPSEIFSPEYHGKEVEIYSYVRVKRPDLKDVSNRAVMCEVLRVLAGFESSWRWTEGEDMAASRGRAKEEIETGIFQVSANSMSFSPTLADCFQRYGGKGIKDYDGFLSLMKSNHALALEYAARLLRFTIRHNGPVKRGEILPWISVAAAREFDAALRGKLSEVKEPAKSDEPKWLELARKEIGQKEIAGTKDNPRIVAYWHDAELDFDDDETPWCAGFVGAMLERAGIDGTASGMARSYERWGVKLHEPTLGCVVTFWRGSKSSGSGHVGFFVGFDASRNLMILGGNQSDAVNIKPFDTGRVTGYWWPKTVAMPDKSVQPRLTSDGRVSTNEA